MQALLRDGLPCPLGLSTCSEETAERQMVINLDPLQNFKPAEQWNISGSDLCRQNMTSVIDSMGLVTGAISSYRVRAFRYSESSPPSNVATMTLPS